MRFYKFDEFKIDTAKRKFFCNGQEIDLRDRDFDVLLYLVVNRKETCSKDEIIKTVWDGTIVEDNSVERAIVNIRKILGDNASSPWFIKTVRGKGYLFICDVEEFDEEDPRIDVFENSTETSQSNVVKSKIQFSKWVFSAGSFVFVVGLLGLIWWNSENVFTYLTTKTVFNEDFASSELNSQKWTFEGNSVKVHKGIARVSLDKLGNGGKLVSDYFPYDSSKPLTIKSRARISYNQSVKEMVRFVGAFGLIGEKDNSEKDFVGLKYANAEVKFQREGRVTTEGFYLVKDDANLLDEHSHCNGTIGPRANAIWGNWFEQKLVYEPSTETFKYFINDEKKGEFLVGKLPADEINSA